MLSDLAKTRACGRTRCFEIPIVNNFVNFCVINEKSVILKAGDDISTRDKLSPTYVLTLK